MKGIIWAVPLQSLGINPMFPNQPHIHCTLQFGVERQAELEGVEFRAIALEECWDKSIQALKLQLPDSIYCQNAHPHITLSMADGVNPFESNAMLEGDHKSRPLNTTVKMKIEFLEWKDD